MGNYDEFAIAYAQGTEAAEEQTRAHFRTLLPDLRGRTLLDVGCGSGHDAAYYASQGADVHGTDISKLEIAMAATRGCGSFAIADMSRLPYRDESFDVVTSLYALQASKDVAASLKEMARVARLGATVLVLAKHPVRNLLEGHVNDSRSDYFEKRNVTSYIFERTIKLNEPGHTLMEYLDARVLSHLSLQRFEEHCDFPASEQVIPGMTHPTYMILQFKKR